MPDFLNDGQVVMRFFVAHSRFEHAQDTGYSGFHRIRAQRFVYPLNHFVALLNDQIAQHGLDVAETMANSEITASSDLFLPFVMITLLLGAITAYYLWKLRKSS